MSSVCGDMRGYSPGRIAGLIVQRLKRVIER